MGTITTMAEQIEKKIEALEEKIIQLKDDLLEAEYQNNETMKANANLHKAIESGYHNNTEQYKHIMDLLEQNQQLRAENAFLKGKVEIMGRNALEKFQSLEYTIASYKQGVMWDSKLSQEVKEVVP